ncbi:unnamed protein product [Notodromas monacha]|uniref:Peptidase S1 domain-containing protein n=1 Tax=Notodromas monacha TaxID=399045 RepID=A0A7R9GHE8_9CRUS|nr:unnamed protein product [Notodromas monacha]CAG0922807.1 unnamed protein product [Notodromas monacha]
MELASLTLDLRRAPNNPEVSGGQCMRAAIIQPGTPTSQLVLPVLPSGGKPETNKDTFYAEITIRDASTCTSAWSCASNLFDSAKQICFGGPPGMNLACDGDIGGPLVIGKGSSAILVGIISFTDDTDHPICDTCISLTTTPTTTTSTALPTTTTTAAVPTTTTYVPTTTTPTAVPTTTTTAAVPTTSTTDVPTTNTTTTMPAVPTTMMKTSSTSMATTAISGTSTAKSSPTSTPLTSRKTDPAVPGQEPSKTGAMTSCLSWLWNQLVWKTSERVTPAAARVKRSPRQASYGPTCCTNKPAVATRVTAYLEWIEIAKAALVEKSTISFKNGIPLTGCVIGAVGHGVGWIEADCHIKGLECSNFCGDIEQAVAFRQEATFIAQLLLLDCMPHAGLQRVNVECLVMCIGCQEGMDQLVVPWWLHKNYSTVVTLTTTTTEPPVEISQCLLSPGCHGPWCLWLLLWPCDWVAHLEANFDPWTAVEILVMVLARAGARQSWSHICGWSSLSEPNGHPLKPAEPDGPKDAELVLSEGEQHSKSGGSLETGQVGRSPGDKSL